MKINNLDTKYSIDTYQLFDFNDEMEYFNLDWCYDDYDWTYDNKWYTEALAKQSIKYIKELVSSDVIQNITLVSVYSPKFYNYTTDNYVMDIEYDQSELNKFIKKNRDKYIEYSKDLELDTHTELCFYINSFDDDMIDDYYYNMTENVLQTTYTNFTKITNITNDND